MSKKKKKLKSEEEEEELQERLKKEEELFKDLFGVSIEKASEKDIEETLESLEKIEKEMEIPHKKETKVVEKRKVSDLEEAVTDRPPPLPKPKEIAPLPKIAPKTIPKAVPPKSIKTSTPTYISVKRGFDYIEGDIRFKIAVQNISDKIISDINVVINPTTQFSIADRVKAINLLKPDESRGIDFILTPLDCGRSKIYGTISYVDYQGNPFSATIEPKEIQIKCPLVQPKIFTRETIEDLKNKLEKSSWAIEFLALPAKQAYSIIREQISALDVTEIYNNTRELRSEWSGLAKVTGQELIITAFILENQINLEVYSQDLKQATGLLAYIKNIIKLAIENAQKIGGTIEKIGVNILDSFEVCKKSMHLASLCEIQPLISDIVITLKELQAKITKTYPDSRMSRRITLWISTLSKKFDLDQVINERLGTALIFDIIQWLKEVKSVTQANAKIYEETFTDYVKLGSVEEGLDALYKDIDEVEQKYSLKILRYLIVVQKNTGITLYKARLGSDVELDPFLVSGFLSAISSFGSELSMTKKESKMKKLTYEDFEIEMEDGEYIRAALLLHGKGTKLLSDKLAEFTHQFEEKYFADIVNFAGKISVFNQASELLVKIMPSVKIYPATEKDLEDTIPGSKPSVLKPIADERFEKKAVGTLKVVSVPTKADTTIKPKQIKVITPKPLMTTPKIQTKDETGEASDFRCSHCGELISKKDLTKIEMGFIIPCKECGEDLIGEAIKKDLSD